MDEADPPLTESYCSGAPLVRRSGDRTGGLHGRDREARGPPQKLCQCDIYLGDVPGHAVINMYAVPLKFDSNC